MDRGDRSASTRLGTRLGRSRPSTLVVGIVALATMLMGGQALKTSGVDAARRSGPSDRPLRVLLLGDSIMGQTGAQTIPLLRGYGAEVKIDAQWGTGLLSADTDWVRRAADDVATFDPDVAVVLFVGNYVAPYPLGVDRRPIPSRSLAFYAAWQAKADALMAALTRRGAAVWWAAPPPMADHDDDLHATGVYRAAAELASDYPGTHLIDPGAAVAGPRREWVAAVPDCAGDVDPVRDHDRLHLTASGAQRMAAVLASSIVSVFELAPIPGQTVAFNDRTVGIVGPPLRRPAASVPVVSEPQPAPEGLPAPEPTPAPAAPAPSPSPEPPPEPPVTEPPVTAPEPTVPAPEPAPEPTVPPEPVPPEPVPPSSVPTSTGPTAPPSTAPPSTASTDPTAPPSTVLTDPTAPPSTVPTAPAVLTVPTAPAVLTAPASPTSTAPAGAPLQYGAAGATPAAEAVDSAGLFPEGYLVVSCAGQVHAFGAAVAAGSPPVRLVGPSVVGLAATPSGQGYWVVDERGGVTTFGDASFFGALADRALARPIVGMAATPSGGGYWLVASDGGLFAFGDADFFGSMGGMTLNRPIVGMAAMPSGGGYWLVASDGGLFAFGDATFAGSTGAMTLTKSIVGIAVTPTGLGYWLLASDGGIFAFGDADFLGSAAA